MTIKVAVDTGLELVRQIEEMEERLKVCEAVLRAAAIEGPVVDLEDPERDGRQYLAVGSSGATVPVVVTADAVIQTFPQNSPAHAKIEAASFGSLLAFYTPLTTWKCQARSGKAFRRDALEMLGAERAAAFVNAALARDKYGNPKNQVRVEWDRAEDAQ